MERSGDSSWLELETGSGEELGGPCGGLTLEKYEHPLSWLSQLSLPWQPFLAQPGLALGSRDGECAGIVVRDRVVEKEVSLKTSVD